MTLQPRHRIPLFLAAAAALGLALPGAVFAQPRTRGGGSGGSGGQTRNKPEEEKKPEKVVKEKKEKKDKKKGKQTYLERVKEIIGEDAMYIRWGQQKNETDEKYDKRYYGLLKTIKQDKEKDFSGGIIHNGRKFIEMWTYMGYPFIVRTDIDKKFTADTVMYMQMLHREYGNAYKKILGKASQVKEPIEVIVFADRITYMFNGGSPGSGGFFTAYAHLYGDRMDHWKARHFRLQQFTDGITRFEKWEKGVLKHEAAHMELQMRLGMKADPRYGGLGLAVDCPRWFNEGHASVFEYWDFDKTAEENFEEIPFRGRYAPVIRRIHGTERWKPFSYVWDIDPQTWHRDMTSEQGFLNYCQAWSLAAYMMHSMQGRKDFRAIFNLSLRVGEDYRTTMQGDRTQAWTAQFPIETRKVLEENWEKWVAENVNRDKKVPDEEYYLRLFFYNPDILATLEHFPKEEWEVMEKENLEEEERRKNSRVIEK